MALPAPITLFLPWVASALAAWLLTDKLSQLVNGLIIAALFALSVAVCILTSGVPLTSLSVGIVIGYSAAIFGLLKPCMDFLSVKVPSPLAALAPAPVVAPMTGQGTVSTAGTIRAPQPLTLPPGKQFISGPGVVPGNTATPVPPPPPGNS
jgi:hypothetical protein